MFMRDDGTEINPDLIAKPSLCVSCKKDDLQSEEVLCVLTRQGRTRRGSRGHFEEERVESIKCRVTSDVVMVRFDPGELLLEGLREVIRAEGVRTGVVVSGIGSLSVCRLHQVVAGYPPNLMTRRQEYFELKGSYEITSIQGIIAEGEPHLHMTVCEGNHTVAGHLEDGCVILGVAEVAILSAEGTPVRRLVRGPEKIKQLTASCR